MNYTRDEIERMYEAGEKLKYLFFWGHKKHPSGEVSSSCFSQWWVQPFLVDGIDYQTTEHYMMAEKARLFKDSKAETKILDSSSPGEAKKLGRTVRGFDQSVWENHRSAIVVKGNFHKFNQNKLLKEFLLKTNTRILVEASPVDTIWGIGLNRESEFASTPTKWRGLNLLGFALMEVRDQLKT